MNKGGKFVFRKLMIATDGTIQFSIQAVKEYDITADRKVYLFTGSKSTGGFCITRKGLLLSSKLNHILIEHPELLNYSTPPGKFIPHKGRSYAWLEISNAGKIMLTKRMMEFLDIKPGMFLLSIRSSNIAFTMGAKDPLLKKAEKYEEIIPEF